MLNLKTPISVLQLLEFLQEKSSVFLRQFRYQAKKKISPQDFLSGRVQGGKFPKVIRRDRISVLPQSLSDRLFLFIFSLLFIFLTDILIKQWFSTNLKIYLDGIGSLGNLGAAAWQVLATVISVGLATIGIILQAISQEKNEYKRKLLLHHYFTVQQLDFKILYSFFVLILAGLVLLFKEKMFLYPFLSEHIFVVFALIVIFVYIFARLIIKSFDYLFPENQSKYFDYSLQNRLLYLIQESARSLILIDVLQLQLNSLEMGIRYLYDEQDKKKLNMAVIETSQKGSIEDIDLALLKSLSKLLGKKYIKEEKGKSPVKAELYIEYGRQEQRIKQPLAIVHKDNYSDKIVHLFKQAIILSTLLPPKIEYDLQEYLDWIWDQVREDLKNEKVGVIKDNLRNLYDFFENSLTIFGSYKKEYKIEDGASIDNWDFLNKLRRQYFVILDSAYGNKSAFEPLFSLNYFPFALMQRAIYQNNKTQFTQSSELIVWVYKYLFKFNHPRQNDLRENFFLTNLNFAQFYLLGGREDFKENFNKRKFYLWVYLRTQINIIRRALEFGDNRTVTEILSIIEKLIKETSYWQEQIPYIDLKENVLTPQEEFRSNWYAMILGVQAWVFQQYETGGIDRDKFNILASVSLWSDIFSLTNTFSVAIGQDLEHIMSWDWWSFEKRSYLNDGGSFGGFENEICKWYVIQAIKLLSKVQESEIPTQKRLLKDKDTYFKLLISPNGTIYAFLELLKKDGDKYLFLFNDLDKNSLNKNIEKLKNYLKLTLEDNEVSKKNALISASIENSKINKFKQSFISGYEKNSKIRKIAKTKKIVTLALKQTGKPFFGIHVLLDKEPFTSLSIMDYDTIAEHYGQQMADVEDYLIIKEIFNSKNPTTKLSYNASNVKLKLDAYLSTIDKNQIKSTYILILGSATLRHELHRDPEYKWSGGKSNRITFDEYKGIKIYWTNIGKENGVVVVDMKNAFKVVQKKPNIEKGEMISKDKHIAFLIAQLTDNEVDEIFKNRPQDSNKDQIKTNVRFWSFVNAEVEIVKPSLVFKIAMQTDEMVATKS